MKQCFKVHFENLEKGDRIRLTGHSITRTTITVGCIYYTTNFGPVIEDDKGEPFYWNDYDKVELVELV